MLRRLKTESVEIENPTIIVKYIEKNIVEDSWDEGEIGKHQTIVSDSNIGSFKSYNAMMNELSKKWTFPQSGEGWEIMDEGRITCLKTEDGNGADLSKREYDQWKAGEFTAYIATYDIYFLVGIVKTPSVKEIKRMFRVH